MQELENSFHLCTKSIQQCDILPPSLKRDLPLYLYNQQYKPHHQTSTLSQAHFEFKRSAKAPPAQNKDGPVLLQVQS